jgi:endogenous inhibitor of DNA gyrase (YacG/DUF329 family)
MKDGKIRSSRERVVRCPACGREAPFEGNPCRPFCSRGCKGMDLIHWARGDYRISSRPEGDAASDERDEEPGNP